MYSYEWDKKTHGYKLTTQTGRYVANELRPVFAPELSITGLEKRFEYDKNEKRPLLWAQKNIYLIADEDDLGNPIGRKVAELKNTQYGKPLSPEFYFTDKLKLEPVDIEAMIAVNSPIMDIVIADAKRRTKELFDADINRCDIAYIAFSGGKDSVALLDICHRVLPLSVPVIFSDTDMELPDTYKVWEEVQFRYPDREFISAKAESSAIDNWRRFAPPSRTIRWCCSVHKSTPALMLLKDKLHKPAIKAMAFVGVRGDESYSRSFYEDATDGVKNASQLNRMPILDWGSHELWLYIFANDLMINEAYRKGISRIGCIMCPESSSRYIWFAQKSYPQLVKIYSDIIIETSSKTFKSENDKNQYIGSVDWGARKSGAILKNTISSPYEVSDNLKVTFHSPHLSKELFYEWIKPIGTVVIDMALSSQRLKLKNSLDNGIPFKFMTPCAENSVVTFEFRNENEKKAMLPLTKTLLRKVSACISCRSCEAECNFGAITFHNKKIKIDNDKCVKCGKCYETDQICWRFKSMFKSDTDNKGMSGINKYNHFGLREEWISALIERRNNFFPWTESHQLGDSMVKAASIWFKEALLIKEKERTPTLLVDLFEKHGVSNIFAWEFVWIALANNAILFKWFILETKINTIYPLKSLIINLSENNPALKLTSIKDGITSLRETVSRSPLGRENGLAEVEMKGTRYLSITRKSKDADPLTILYGLYLIAAKTERSSFTVRELLNADENSVYISPIVAFGMTADSFMKKCEGLKSRYPNYISTTFTFGLDELTLYPDKYTTEDIVKLALEE